MKKTLFGNELEQFNLFFSPIYLGNIEFCYVILSINDMLFFKISKKAYSFLLNLVNSDSKTTFFESIKLNSGYQISELEFDTLYRELVENHIQLLSTYKSKKIHIFPRKTTNKIAKHLHFVFYSYFYVLSMIFFALIISKLDFYDFFCNFNLLSLVQVIFSSAFSLLFHEIGHASALSSLGQNPGSIGISFDGAGIKFYTILENIKNIRCDHRIRINLAGVYFQILMSNFIYVVNIFKFNLDIFFVINLYFIFVNLLPIGNSDGKWVINDLRAHRKYE